MCGAGPLYLPAEPAQRWQRMVKAVKAVDCCSPPGPLPSVAAVKPPSGTRPAAALGGMESVRALGSPGPPTSASNGLSLQHRHHSLNPFLPHLHREEETAGCRLGTMEETTGPVPHGGQAAHQTGPLPSVFIPCIFSFRREFSSTRRS